MHRKKSLCLQNKAKVHVMSVRCEQIGQINSFIQLYIVQGLPSYAEYSMLFKLLEKSTQLNVSHQTLVTRTLV